MDHTTTVIMQYISLPRLVNDKIQVIISTTTECNLDCKYCYRKKFNLKTESINRNTIRSLYSKLKNYNDITFIWHGGEPLLLGKTFYERTFEDQKTILSQKIIKNCVQTNATLLDEEWIELFQTNDVEMGISYDGELNEKTRGGTTKVLSAINLLRTKKINFGLIHVITKENVHNLTNDYDIYKKWGTHITFNFDYLNEKEIDSYLSNLELIYTKWVKEECDSKFVSLENIRNLVYGTNCMCDNNSCLLKFISISPQGNLYFCSRLSYKEFCLGNIHDYDNIEDAFLSKNAMEFTKQSIIRRNTCMSTCDLFHICNGGCNANSYTTDGVEKINPMYCKYIRKAYEMSQSVMDNDT